MNYYNEREIPNHREIKINYLNKYKKKKVHRSTDNIFGTYRGYTLHTIYNKFLINPYLVRNSRYKNAINENTQRPINRYSYNNSVENGNGNLYLNNINNENINKIFSNYETKEYNNKPKNLKFPKINFNLNNMNKGYYIRKKIINEENKNNLLYENNNNKEIKEPIVSEKKYIPEYPKIKNDNYNTINNISIERPIEYNIKTERDYNNSYYTNNNDKLYLSYDKKQRYKYLNRSLDTIQQQNEYISPVIAKIAKHNYLMRNPYSDKKEYLGPSRLKNNPILYPVITYKFDFNRFIRDYHVNKLF